MIIAKRVSFDAAHYLPNYAGKCRNMHGHRWVVELGIKGILDPRTGMVVDFTWIKKVLGTVVTKKFDHTNLNNFFDNPTAENIAKYIFGKIMNEWIQGPTEPIIAEFVRVWESEDSVAEYTREDWKNEQT